MKKDKVKSVKGPGKGGSEQLQAFAHHSAGRQSSRRSGIARSWLMSPKFRPQENSPLRSLMS